MKQDTSSLSTSAEDWPDNLPPCLIHVDKDGRFWHLGAEMIHEGINRLIMEHVDLDEKGRYVVSFRGQRCFAEVEDTFFVIKSCRRRPQSDDLPEAYLVTLNDGSEEELDPATLVQNQDNVLYAKVKAGRFPARFLRQAYYYLADRVIEKGGAYYLPVNSRDYRIL